MTAKARSVRAEREQAYKAIQERSGDPGLLNCVADCQLAGSSQQVACMQTAETADALKVCMSL